MVSERGVARVAVIGSGPAGIYTAQALTDPAAGTTVQVDVYDRLPVPYGLVRYGVAPDHPKIKSIIGQLRRVMERPAVRFLGNVRLGRDVTLAELRAYYDAVVVACGASADRRLSVPGEDLPGSISATEFVSWYSGHPDAAVDGIALTATGVAVVGAGNVALDVARMLLTSVERIAGHRHPRARADGAGRQPRPGRVHPRPPGRRAGQVLQQGTARGRRAARRRRPDAAAGPAP